MVLDCLCHFLLKCVELQFVFTNFSLLALHLLDLLIQIMLDEVHFEEHVDLRIFPMVLIIKTGVVLRCLDLCLLSENLSIQMWQL